MNMHVQTDLSSSSSRVTPVVDEGVVDVECSGGPQHATEHTPEDAWLPVTESRKGNTFTATVHLLCSGIGFQALLLPIAFVSLGWTWGIICFSVAYLWQLYTIWLLVNLHESSPQPGVRYSRFLQLSIITFGPKLGKLLAIFPVLYLSSGACIFYINAGGNAMRTFYKLVCDDSSSCNSDALSGVEWFLIFACMAIFIAQFYPNLNSLAPVMLIGSITAIAFCTLLWISITVNHNELASVSNVEENSSTSTATSFRDVMNGIAVIVFAFRGHNLVLEIQGTMPTNYKVRSNKPMWRGVTISYILIAVCLYPLAVVGHWAYGNTVTSEGGLLSAFTNNHTSKYIIGTVQLIIIINYLCTFQIYAMVSFDNLERIYVSKNNGPCPKWIRSIIKILFGGVLYFVAVALPFMPRLATLFGSVAMLVTFVYPCFMWLSIKKPLRLSGMWWLNMGLGSAGLVLSVLIFISAVWTLVVNHFHANFFNP